MISVLSSRDVESGIAFHCVGWVILLGCTFLQPTQEERMLEGRRQASSRSAPPKRLAEQYSAAPPLVSAGVRMQRLRGVVDDALFLLKDAVNHRRSTLTRGARRSTNFFSRVSSSSDLACDPKPLVCGPSVPVPSPPRLPVPVSPRASVARPRGLSLVTDPRAALKARGQPPPSEAAAFTAAMDEVCRRTVFFVDEILRQPHSVGVQGAAKVLLPSYESLHPLEGVHVCAAASLPAALQHWYSYELLPHEDAKTCVKNACGLH